MDRIMSDDPLLFSPRGCNAPWDPRPRRSAGPVMGPGVIGSVGRVTILARNAKLV